MLQRVRDAIAALPQGVGPDGEAYTWESQKQIIVDELDPFLGEGSERRAEILLRTSGFQAFSSTIWNISQADEDTTHLQYIHGDQAKDPTPSHVALDGVVLPKDDPFWDTHTGPWGHLGCVCYVRPMNEDLVAEEQAKDDTKANPEDRNVVDGPALEQLRNGTFMRGGRRHDVSAPEGEGAFKWHPDDLRIPLDSLKPRYDQPVWDAFHLWAMNTMVEPGTTVWNWLSSKPVIVKPGRADLDRIGRTTARKILERSTNEGIEENEYANREDLSRDSQRFFAGGQAAFGQLERIWGADVAPAILRPIQKEWSAQVAAVATGRKPLFHESFGGASEEVAKSLRGVLPESVVVKADNGQVFVYRPDVIGKLADPSKDLWNQVRDHSDDGVWLGYGVNRGNPAVIVKIVDSHGNDVAGFLAPKGNPESFAIARAEDFTLATGSPHTAVILKDQK